MTGLVPEVGDLTLQEAKSYDSEQIVNALEDKISSLTGQLIEMGDNLISKDTDDKTVNGIAAVYRRAAYELLDYASDADGRKPNLVVENFDSSVTSQGRMVGVVWLKPNESPQPPQRLGVTSQEVYSVEIDDLCGITNPF